MTRLRVSRLGATTTEPNRLRVSRLGVSTASPNRLRVSRLGVDTEVSLIANAGQAQTVEPLTSVQLDGSASSGGPTGYAWTQTQGTPVSLLPSAAVAKPTFVAPAVPVGDVLKFMLVVTDAVPNSSTNDPEVTITVLPQVDWWLDGSSQWQPKPPAQVI